jgi:hypothetical protein
MTSPTVSPVIVQVPEKHTLQISFSQTSWSMSSKHFTRNPPERHTSAICSSLGVVTWTAHRCTKAADDPDHDLVPAEHACCRVRSAEPVLDRQHHGVVTDEGFCRSRGLLDVHCFGGDDHQVARARFGSIGRRVQFDSPITRRAFQTQAFGAHRLDMLFPGIDSPDFVAGVGQ